MGATPRTPVDPLGPAPLGSRDLGLDLDARGIEGLDEEILHRAAEVELIGERDAVVLAQGRHPAARAHQLVEGEELLPVVEAVAGPVPDQVIVLGVIEGPEDETIRLELGAPMAVSLLQRKQILPALRHRVAQPLVKIPVDPGLLRF